MLGSLEDDTTTQQEPLGMMKMMMYMNFYNSNKLCLLIKQLDSKGDTTKYIGLLAICAALVFILETLSYFRYTSIYRINKVYKGEYSLGSKLMIVANYAVSVSIAYAIMLAIMSFNVGVFLAVVFSCALCELGFGYLKHKHYPKLSDEQNWILEEAELIFINKKPKIAVQEEGSETHRELKWRKCIT